MTGKQTYILGLNTYDHDVSACLLRDGEIAFAIAKERITRETHASGFYTEVVDYCLDAEGISLDDIDLVVRNCYILPVAEMEQRLLPQEAPFFREGNERIVREAGFDNVWIQPAAGDDGIAIGCAYYGHLAIQKKARSFVMTHAYLGAAYSETEVREVTDRRLVRMETRRTSSRDICADTARVLAEGHVVGWFQGRSEFGPRALGNRSILADPRNPEMKALVNGRVKYRQAFRPFAPIVLAERASEIFEDDEPSPFMLLAKHVRPEWKDKIPAVVHVDGTARVQTVEAETNDRLYRLLEAFEALTGVPVLLNTSFNVKGEPIVETPQDAMDCFLATGIDYLVLHDMLIGKGPLRSVVTSLVRVCSDVGALVRTAMAATHPYR